MPNLIQTLYEYVLQIDHLPSDMQQIAEQEGIERAACDYIAGMTDHFAVALFQKNCGSKILGHLTKMERRNANGFAGIILQELKLRNSIEDVASSYVQLKRRGRNLVGLCPFHNEHTPSFNLYPESGSFYCFGCGAGGDVITFVRRIENLDYMEAVKFLADRGRTAIARIGCR